MSIAAVVLAAGSSSRFGSPKSLAPFDDATVLDAVVAVAHAAALEPVIVVVPSGVRAPAGTVRVPNDDPEAGMSRSLKVGLAAVPPVAAGAVVMLGDQPAIPPALIRRLLAARGDRPVVALRAAGVVSPPVALERRAFGLAESVSGDTGLRAVLASEPELVAFVDIPRPIPDLDHPEDLLAIAERCPGCGGRYAATEAGETHDYIGASPACWATFGEVLAREFGDPAYGWIHRHTVDVYTVQHPGTDGRRERQSVALHLIGLCHWLEHGLTMERLNPVTQRLAQERRPWPWLEPPLDYSWTVGDVLAATSGDEHAAFVRRWAEDVWDAWSPHHQLIRRWAAEALD